MAQLPENNANSNIKILSVVWYNVLPPKFGGQKAVAFFNDYLGAETTLLCLCAKNNETIKTSYEIFPELPTGKLQFVNPFVWRKIYSFTKRHNITHLILEFPYHGIAGFICKKLLKVKLIISAHNIEFLRFKEQKKWWWRWLRHFEKWVSKNADTIFFKTEVDRTKALKEFFLEQEKTEVLPYGVEKAASFSKAEAQAIIRERYKIPATDKILLFAGTLDYAPNADAINAIKEHIIPCLTQISFRYRIIICGRNKFKKFQYLNQLADPDFILAGEVQDIDKYFKAADVFINPVIGGGGIQTKTMDALSFHLNIVCFHSKCSGIDCADEKIFSVQNGNWKDFSASVIKASGPSTETSQAFFSTYNWRSIATKAYQSIASL